MRVVELVVEADGLPRLIRFCPQDEENLLAWSAQDRNWVTVLLGENGTRKSLLLRLLAGAALGKNTFQSSGHRVARSKILFDKHVDDVLVVALSGTPNDRFPVHAGIPIYRRPTNFDIDSYEYFGPRTGAAGMGARRQLATLAHSILSDISRSFKRRTAIASILSFMGLKTSIQITLSPVESMGRKEGASRDEMQSARMKTILDKANNMDSWLASNEATWGSSLRGYVSSLLESETALRRAANYTLETQRINLNFGAEYIDEFITQQFAWSSEELANMVAIGQIRVNNIRLEPFTSSSDESYSNVRHYDADDLSSGQWQLLTGLLNLSLTVRDDSLVLIDEPENSLHPGWQREYVDMLFAALAETKGCHIVIATHSPLVAAGVPWGSGTLFAATKSVDGHAIQVSDVGTVYAWRPDDVLREKFLMESARAPELEKLADRLLSIISGTADSAPGLGEQEKLAARLKILANRLPIEDPLVPALKTLIKMALDQRATENP